MPGDFLDSNVLLSVASGDISRAERAEALISRGGIISVQVLNEAANVARRKFAMDWDEIDDLLGRFRAVLTVRDVTLATHELGLRMARRYRLALYDAMLVAAAVQGACDRFFSEDLHHGLVIDGSLTIINPFHA